MIFKRETPTGRVRRGPTALLLVLAVGLLSCFAASSAGAATVYRFEGPQFGIAGSEEAELTNGETAAVDDHSGLVLMPTYPARLNIYRTSGGATTLVEKFEEKELTGPEALAIDQAKRVLYVLQRGVITKYAISDVSGKKGPLGLTLDPVFHVETGLSNSPRMAVDPTNGDLLVADRYGGEVKRYKSDGTLLGGFNGAGSPGGPFSQIFSLAVGPTGEIYVVDVKTNLFYGNAESVVERFAPGGTPDPTFAPGIPTPQSVVVDQNSGNVVVIGRTNTGIISNGFNPPLPVRMYTLDGDEIIDEQDFPMPNGGTLVQGLAIGGTTVRYLYTATAPGASEPTSAGGRLGAYALRSFEVPDVTMEPVGAVTPFTAAVSGHIDPEGRPSSWHFEYSREGAPAESTAVVKGLTTPTAVAAELTELIPDSEYEVRLVGTTEATGASSYSRARHFTTPPAPPLAVTGDAYDLTLTGATVAGKVNPYGQQTEYWFEYGPSPEYGMRTPSDHGEVVGNGREPVLAPGYLSGLQPGTRYHYRVVARNGSGVTFGEDATFLTKSAAAPPRVYEQVSPVEKGGANVNGLRGMNVSPDGSHVMYEWKTSPPGEEAAPVFPRTSATRTPTGWTFTPLDPAQTPGSAEISFGVRIAFTVGISEDGTEAIVDSLKKLTPEAREDATNIYMRNTDTGKLTYLAGSEGIIMYSAVSNVGNATVIDGTPNYSHVLLISQGEPFAEPGGLEGELYDYSEGHLQPVSIAPDGTPMGTLGMGGSSANNSREKHWISEDGSKIFFESLERKTYVRYDFARTTEIGGDFCGASSDGRYAFVVGNELTPDSEPGVESLYRFDTETEETELLVSGVPHEACLVVSPNGKSVFFGSGDALKPGAVAGQTNLYAWHEGELQFIATLPLPLSADYMSSPDGRYFAFETYSRLTGYDNRSKTACVEFYNEDPRGPNDEGVSCKEVIRYDTVTQQILCASCRRDGGPPTGNPRLGTDNVEGNFRFQRSMLDDGTVIFDTPDPLSARDSNSNRDVYTFDGTEQTLISSGFENSRSEFDGASADGKDILFTTQDQLVGQDTDTLADLYDARVEGGIPGQNPPPPRPECIRDDCKATPPGGPELPFGGSEGLNGPQNVHASKRTKCPKGKKARKVKGRNQCVKQGGGKAGKHGKHAGKHRKHAKKNRRHGR